MREECVAWRKRGASNLIQQTSGWQFNSETWYIATEVKHALGGETILKREKNHDENKILKGF